MLDEFSLSLSRFVHKCSMTASKKKIAVGWWRMMKEYAMLKITLNLVSWGQFLSRWRVYLGLRKTGCSPWESEWHISHHSWIHHCGFMYTNWRTKPYNIIFQVMFFSMIVLGVLKRYKTHFLCDFLHRQLTGPRMIQVTAGSTSPSCGPNRRPRLRMLGLTRGWGADAQAGSMRTYNFTRVKQAPSHKNHQESRKHCWSWLSYCASTGGVPEGKAITPTSWCSICLINNGKQDNKTDSQSYLFILVLVPRLFTVINGSAILAPIIWFLCHDSFGWSLCYTTCSLTQQLHNFQIKPMWFHGFPHTERQIPTRNMVR